MATWKHIMPGIQVYAGKHGNTLRYFATVYGKRYVERSNIPYVLAVCGRNHKPSATLREDYAMWVRRLREKAAAEAIASGRMKRGQTILVIPTIDQLAEAYEKIANERRQNPLFRKPGIKAIYTCLNNFRHCVEEAGLTGDSPVTEFFNRNTVRLIFESLGRRKKSITAWSQIVSLKSITAHRPISKYEAMGYRVDPPRLPDKPLSAMTPQYKMLGPEARAKIERWYASLATMHDRRMYLAASMTFQLAMRPIDVGLLTAKNFVRDPMDGTMHLVYTPHKTENSSGRVVDWPMLPELWQLVRDVAGDRLDAGETLISSYRVVYNKLNFSMRLACDMETSPKAVYELRKLCIDTVRRAQGVEAAVALSGDRRETIDHYYSDPYKIVGIKPIAIAAMPPPPPMPEPPPPIEIESDVCTFTCDAPNGIMAS